MEANGNKRAGAVLRATENFDKLLSTVLVGNNIVNITSASIATLFFNSLIKSANLATTVSTVVMTVVVLIFGEITPKLFAKEKPEACAMLFYPLLKMLMIVLTPINLIFSGWKWLLRKIFKFKKTSTITEGELLTIVDVKDIMIPRINVIAVEENSDMESVYDKFVQHGFSRMPVYAENIDAVVGIIHEKDFYALLHDGGKDIKSIIQSSVCVSSSMKISTVLRMLQKAKVHMAIVVDEFGGTEGIVTLEDILEELVGEIYDEHDEIEILFKKVDDKTFIVSGDENVEDMYEKLDLSAPDDTESTTVSGYITELMDKIPQTGEKLTLKDIEIEVTKASAKHVQEVKVTLLENEEEKNSKNRSDEEEESKE